VEAFTVLCETCCTPLKKLKPSRAGLLLIAGAVTAVVASSTAGCHRSGAESEQSVAQNDAQTNDPNPVEQVVTTVEDGSETLLQPDKITVEPQELDKPDEKNTESLEGASLPLKTGDPQTDKPTQSDIANKVDSDADAGATKRSDSGTTTEPATTKGDFVLSEVTAEYYDDPAVKHKMQVSDKEGNLYRVENTRRAKGIYIKVGDQWLKQGVAYRFSKEGNLYTKTSYEKGKKHGDCRRFFPNGALMLEYTHKDGKKEGQYSQYFRDGSIQQEFFYKSGRRDGPSVVYHNGPGGERGHERIVSTYVNDAKHGVIRQYNPEGKLVAKWKYEKGRKVGKTTFYGKQRSLEP